MATFSTAYDNAALDGGNALIASVAVLDGSAVEVDRQNATVPAASGGQAQVVVTFTIPASTTIATWEAYDAQVAGNVVVSDALPNGGETYNSGGTYDLTLTFTA